MSDRGPTFLGWLLGRIAHPRGMTRCRGCQRNTADVHAAARLRKLGGASRVAVLSELCVDCRRKHLRRSLSTT